MRSISPSLAKDAARCPLAGYYHRERAEKFVSSASKRTRASGILFESHLFDTQPQFMSDRDHLSYQKALGTFTKPIINRLRKISIATREHFDFTDGKNQVEVKFEIEPGKLQVTGYIDYFGEYDEAPGEKSVVDIKLTKDIERTWGRHARSIDSGSFPAFAQVPIYAMGIDIAKDVEEYIIKAARIYATEGRWTPEALELKDKFEALHQCTKGFFHVVEFSERSEEHETYQVFEVPTSFQLYVELFSYLKVMDIRIERAGLYLRNLSAKDAYDKIRPTFDKCLGKGYSAYEDQCPYLSTCPFGQKLAFDKRTVNILDVLTNEDY